MGKVYLISMEVAGPTAMWTRPDTGDSPVSYPAPTYSAAKGLFEAVARMRTVQITPVRAEICAPIVYHNYAFNYGGPLRKAKSLQGGMGLQVFASVLVNVIYRLYGELRPESAEAPPLSGAARARAAKGLNALHACQEMFERRLLRGQWHDIPFLGLRDFFPSYMGPLRRETQVCRDITLTLPSFLREVFTPSGQVRPKFDPGLVIREGVLTYAQ